MSSLHFNLAPSKRAIHRCATVVNVLSPITPEGTRSLKVTTGDMRVNGGHLYYEEAGEGEPLLLIHGFTLDTRMWNDQLGELARRYRVIRYDKRGFGRSSLPTGAYAHEDDCKELLTRLRIPKVRVVGLSAGGRVALNVAIRYPNLVERLAVIDTFIGGYLPSQGYRDSMSAISEIARTDLAAAKTRWLAHPFFNQANTQPQVIAKLAEMVEAYGGFHWTRTNPEVPLDPPALTRLTELKVPLLVIVGEADIPDVHTQADLLIRDVVGAKKVVIPQAGHMSNMEAPTEVNRALLDFLCESLRDGADAV